MDQLYVLFNFRSIDTEYDIGEIGNLQFISIIRRMCIRPGSGPEPNQDGAVGADDQ